MRSVAGYVLIFWLLKETEILYHASMVALALLFVLIPLALAAIPFPFTYFAFASYFIVPIYLILLTLFLCSRGFRVVTENIKELAYVLIGGLLWYPVLVSVDIASDGIINHIGKIIPTTEDAQFFIGRFILTVGVICLSRFTGQMVYDRYFILGDYRGLRIIILLFLFIGVTASLIAAFYSRHFLSTLFSGSS